MTLRLIAEASKGVRVASEQSAMRTGFTVSLLLLAASACQEPDVVGNPDSTSRGSEGSVSQGTGSETSSAHESSTSGLLTSSTAGEIGSASAVDEGADGMQTTGDGACEFEPIVCEAASSGKTEPLDCGFVTLDDPLDEWRAAHECARDALAKQVAAKLLWQPTVLDGENFRALVGVENSSYIIEFFSYSRYFDAIDFIRYSCETVAVYEGCIVSVGEMCLECVEPTNYAEHCL